ncbi:Glutathionyl-hydroquinone reductase YqjG [Methyloligella halotolerans]|uniref:Glutathionyl-hydroquinone reductase YqjG n=1 Tax=Methyloligella halotolerans TaxID=1177755 RepID=A0A1E2RY62_9HYPH|nr:glutathione S-transferase family protein [Methyloligella halotolerans]ODA66989.1 Glutathionyl-hydroquinone reductase YqjG [Methyloligella halotolerans]
MGLLIDGEWHDKGYDTESKGGQFEREPTTLRNWITPDGSAGPTGEDGFPAQRGRYHLYVSYACPWAHRAIIFRKLKGLEDIISMDVVHPHMGKDGWTFDADFESATGDRVNGLSMLREVYTKAVPDFTGRVTTPVLWDKERETIVSNESSEIIRMLNSAFDQHGAEGPDFYPDELQDEIDAINEPIYHRVNNGVYRTGFASRQGPYEKAFRSLFDLLDGLEERLGKQRYLVGDTLTEADWRLFVTLVRFDAVYYVHFKCNERLIGEYPNLSNYLRELYQVPGIAETVHLDHIKHHYYTSHPWLNPQGIVPLGPKLDFTTPHDRDRF